MGFLHDLAAVPKDGVGVEISGWVEPKVQSLLSVSDSININVGLNRVGLSTFVTQKLKIEFVVIWTLR